MVGVVAAGGKVDFENKVRDFYGSGLSQHSIGKLLGCSQWKISDTMSRCGIKKRDKTLAIRAHIESMRAPLDESALDSLTKSSAWVIGWILADGCVTGEKSIRVLLKSSDEDVLIKLKKFFRFDGKVYRRRTYLKGNCYYNSNISIVSERLVDRLRFFGVDEKKSLNEKYPKQIMKANESINRMFIRGVFEGDGTVTIYHHKNQASQPVFQIVGTIELLSDIRKVLKSYLDIGNGCLKKNTKNDVNHYALRFVGRHQAIKILDWVYSGGGYFMNRKMDRYLAIKKEVLS